MRDVREAMGLDYTEHEERRSIAATAAMPPRAGIEHAAAAPRPRSFCEPAGRIYGEPLAQMPRDLYIPPDAMAIMLDAFEGPLDLLLYLIRKANVNVLDIPMAPLTAQYLVYVEAMRSATSNWPPIIW
jgi:hypothetical protein